MKARFLPAQILNLVPQIPKNNLVFDCDFICGTCKNCRNYPVTAEFQEIILLFLYGV